MSSENNFDFNLENIEKTLNRCTILTDETFDVTGNNEKIVQNVSYSGNRNFFKKTKWPIQSINKKCIYFWKICIF